MSSIPTAAAASTWRLRRRRYLELEKLFQREADLLHMTVKELDTPRFGGAMQSKYKIQRNVVRMSKRSNESLRETVMRLKATIKRGTME